MKTKSKAKGNVEGTKAKKATRSKGDNLRDLAPDELTRIVGGVQNRTKLPDQY